MIYYFLPDSAIFGGVKVACKFVEMLGAEGVAAAVVTPDGRAPDWFTTRAPILADSEARASLRPTDIAMITWPPDHARLRPLPPRIVCHCQGTDERMNAIFADPRSPS